MEKKKLTLLLFKLVEFPKTPLRNIFQQGKGCGKCKMCKCALSPSPVSHGNRTIV